MELSHAAIWIDHEQAKIFELGREGFDEWRIRPHDRHLHIHHKAGLGDSGKARPDQHYFHSVADAVKDAREILIFGPGTARTELLRHLERHDPSVAKKVVAVQPMDHPTDGEIVAFARRTFKAADRMRPAS
jgi:stalled ribosome rescue protein Dom34